MWTYFSCHLVFPAQIVTHIWRAKAKICSTFAFQFFVKFWTFIWSIQSHFIFHFKNINFFWNWTKIDVFSMELFSLQKNSFFPRKWLPKCELIVRRFLLSSDFFRQNGRRILLTLWLTFWGDCEKNVSGDEYPYYVFSYRNQKLVSVIHLLWLKPFPFHFSHDSKSKSCWIPKFRHGINTVPILNYCMKKIHLNGKTNLSIQLNLNLWPCMAIVKRLPSQYH